MRLLLSLVAFMALSVAAQNTTCSDSSRSLFDFSLPDLEGKSMDFKQYDGKVVLLINTACFWGMTVQNYLELNQLVEKYGSSGLQVIAVPCSQFFNQEPGTNAEVLNCLQYVRPGAGYIPKFPHVGITDVNGAKPNPVHEWVKPLCPQPSEMMSPGWPYLVYSPVMTHDVSWNFEKFLFTRAGQPYKRYTPQTNPLLLAADIESLLAG